MEGDSFAGDLFARAFFALALVARLDRLPALTAGFPSAFFVLTHRVPLPERLNQTKVLFAARTIIFCLVAALGVGACPAAVVLVPARVGAY